jgi:hypothetical protein
MNFYLVVLIFALLGGAISAGYSWINNKDNENFDSSNYSKSFLVGSMIAASAVFGYSALQGSSLVSDQDIYTGNPDF